MAQRQVPLPVIPPDEHHYLFIDGGCLRSMLKCITDTYFNGCEIDLDYASMSKGFGKIFYYDALPPQKNDENAEAYDQRLKDTKDFFNHLCSIDRFHVCEGVSRRRRKVVEQKEVDILIAVDMLTHSFRGNMRKATLLTADLDFRPLIEALVREGTNLTLWYPKGKANEELLYAADSLKQLTTETIALFFSEKFRENNPLPQASLMPERGSTGEILMTSWIPDTGPECKIYHHTSKFELAFPESDRPGYCTTVSHPDLDILKKYVQECFPVFWKEPI
jgi:uncharacterized LabA/DUF88 family protein